MSNVKHVLDANAEALLNTFDTEFDVHLTNCQGGNCQQVAYKITVWLVLWSACSSACETTTSAMGVCITKSLDLCS